MKQIRKRLTYANVMSSIAIFLVLGGGAALAAGKLGKNTVGSKQLKKNAVTGTKIKDGVVTSGKIADGSIITAKLADGSVVTGKIVNAAVTSDKLADGSVVAIKLGNGAVTTVKLLDAAVTTGKLADNAVTAPKIATDAVGSSEVAADAIGSSEIASSVVGAEELDTVHEHFGPETEITDATAHDGAYSISSATVSCGFGEDLLSVSVDWTAGGGHNERHFVGVSTIDRSGDPDTATVEVSYDGGATTAEYRPVATCIF
ncbi:MAG TPA: hypothetical protein VID51_00175 [Solirubrobacterales bacterium]